jgi:hypothetical protein
VTDRLNIWQIKPYIRNVQHFLSTEEGECSVVYSTLL